MMRVAVVDYGSGNLTSAARALVRAAEQAGIAADVSVTADPAEVARAVTAIVDAPGGKRPFRIVVDPASDGASVSYAVIDRVREQFLDRIGFADLRHPTNKAKRE